MIEEIWKKHQTGYKVSNLGRIVGKRGGKGFIRSNDGYMAVKLWKKTYAYHLIVWETFNGKVPEGYEINHIDLDKTNNALSNLELLTHKENVQHAYKVGNFDKNRGEKNPNSKLTEGEVKLIRQWYYSKVLNQREIGEAFGVSHRTVSMIVNNKIWKNVQSD